MQAITLPSHGKSRVTDVFGPKHCPSCPKGFVGASTHRGTLIASDKQEQLFHIRGIRHTDWVRSRKGNLRGERKFV